MFILYAQAKKTSGKGELLGIRRSENSYREHSREDLAQLKKIIIFRKLGFSVSDIRGLLQDRTSLQEALTRNISSLQEQMKELEGAVKVCQIMQSRSEELASFDQDFYWEEIRTEEQAGNKFLALLVLIFVEGF